MMGAVRGPQDMLDFQHSSTWVDGLLLMHAHVCGLLGSCEWDERVADALFSKGQE